MFPVHVHIPGGYDKQGQAPEENVRHPLCLSLAALTLAGCVTTVGDTLKEGGQRLNQRTIPAAFAGRTMQADFVQGYIATHTFRFAEIGDELLIDNEGGGKWFGNEKGLLCLEWPRGLGWSSPDYCFIALREGNGYGLYDTTIEQIRIRLSGA